MFNNLSYKGKNSNLTCFHEPFCVLINNQFDLDQRITDQDFVSLNETQLTVSRNADGSVTEIDFMKLNQKNNSGIFARP